MTDGSSEALARTARAVRTNVFSQLSVIRHISENRTQEVNNYINIVYMKAKSKSQLAEMAGVSVDTLREWMKPFRQDLEAMGLRQNARVLPPNIVKFLAEKLCIDVED